MKKIILFYGSFDPIHNGHLKIAKEALKLIKGDELYFGLNKNSHLKNLTPFTKRKKMIELAIEHNTKFFISNILFDYNDIEKTYTEILNNCNDDNEYYILVGQDQLALLHNWHNFSLLKEKFKFIIANRGNITFDINPNYIYLNNKVYNISSKEIREGNYKDIPLKVKEYIINNNIYLEKQIKKYMSPRRLKHTLSVKKLALKIYKYNKNDLNTNKIITACLLHDIAKEYPLNKTKIIMKKYYSDKIKENASVYHQYIGEYIAIKKFHIQDKEILEAIKYHTTGHKNMSKLAKLVYVSDKLDPLKKYDSSLLINECLNNLEQGFISVLKKNIGFLHINGLKYNHGDTNSTIDYYLKGDILS